MKKSWHKNGVTVSEFDNKSSFDVKKTTGGKKGNYDPDSAVDHPAGSSSKKKGRGGRRKARLAAILSKHKKG